MDCPEENVIVDFVRGELPKLERAGIEAHIDECGACAQVVAEMARIFADPDDDATSAPPAQPITGPTLGTDGAFSPSSATLGPSQRAPEQLLPQGAKLGRYVVIDRVGAGGMGVVYAAYDPELDRKVALKVLRSTPKKSGGGRNDQRTRLLREAQAMAKLSHPNVITVHDVGTFDDQVFLAMEFIDGGTLSQWLHKEGRTWREVLRVFRAAGAGLQSAHAVGLVHRDFKPDNVLMGTDGRVLVTDFGLARPAAGNTGRFADLSYAEGDHAVLGASLTLTGALVGTPAYMAPEQLLGRSTDALSDQFSFCVALYEALYGERPFEGQALVELVHNVTEGNVRPPPRDATVSRWLRRAVVRGLAVDTKHRYRTMEDLLVALRRDPWRQWRRWGAVTIPTAVLGVGVIAFQQVERAEATYCDRVPDMLAGVWDPQRELAVEAAFDATARPYAAEAFDSAKRSLDTYGETWVQMQTAVCRDELRAEQPQAVLALRMACLSRRLGSLQAVTELLAGADADTVAASVDAVQALPALSTCEDLTALTERGELEQTPETREAAEGIDRMAVEAQMLLAAAKYGEAQTIAERIIERSRAEDYRRGEAEGLFISGRGLLLAGDREQAEAAFHHAWSASLAAGHSLVMARASVGLVWITGESGRPLAESERWAAHGLAALERSGRNPRIEGELYHALAAARLKAGRLDAADEALDRGLSAVSGTDDQSVHPGLLTNKGGVMLKRERNEEALAFFEEAAKEVQARYGQRHPNAATALDNMGTAMARLGRLREAMELQQEALEIRRGAFDRPHVHVGGSHQNLSITLYHLGDLEGAAEHAQKAVEVMRAALGERSLELSAAISQVAAVQRAAKNYPTAATEFRSALDMALAVGGPDHPATIGLRHELGATLSLAGQPQEALGLLELALTQRTALHGATDTKVGDTRLELARAKILLGAFDGAVEHAEAALAIASDAAAADAVADASFELARALWSATRPDRARARTLSTLARDHYLTADPDEAVRVGTWISEHP